MQAKKWTNYGHLSSSSLACSVCVHAGDKALCAFALCVCMQATKWTDYGCQAIAAIRLQAQLSGGHPCRTQVCFWFEQWPLSHKCAIHLVCTVDYSQ
jgi:hypothetical protein